MKPALALGHWVAGVRVLLGATGVLFAVEGARRGPVRQTLSSRVRRPPARDALQLAAYLVRQDPHCDLTRLHFFSRWTHIRTGSVKGIVLVQVPEDVRVAGFVWRVPEKAALLWRNQELSLDFATFSSLRFLTDFSSCDALLSEYAFC